ncbi:hypothetical protein [Streptobacillus canis]|uniref:hypothetical protein n=1 Tax=Streptobacillus canis TaxID=2678686 RepID=UPI0012E0CB08|nr:hypothetical protein [Streptobacillus canis]
MKKIILALIILLILSTCSIIVKNTISGLFFFPYYYILLNPKDFKEENRIKKEEILNNYKENKNIILPEDLFDIKYYDTLSDENNNNYNIIYRNDITLRTDIIKINNNIVNDDFLIHKIGEKEYIINKYFFDKNKGNDFSKIEEYIEKNKNEIYKALLGDEWRKGRKIFFEIEILYKIDNKNFYWDNKKISIKDHEIYESQKLDLINYVEENEKKFFDKKTKYEEIDWTSYINFMKSYPVLRMYIEYENSSGNIEILEINSNFEKYEELVEIYRKIEKWYNKDTFDFII